MILKASNKDKMIISLAFLINTLIISYLQHLQHGEKSMQYKKKTNLFIVCLYITIFCPNFNNYSLVKVKPNIQCNHECVSLVNRQHTLVYCVNNRLSIYVDTPWVGGSMSH